MNPAKTKKTRESLGKAGIKQDALMREQLTVWFDAVREVQNPVIAEKIEAWILEQAGIVFDAKAESGKLRAMV